MSTNKLTALSKSLPDLQIVCDLDGNYIDCFGGADPDKYQGVDDIVGKKLSDFFDEELCEKFLNHIELSVNLNEIVELEYPFQHQDEQGLGIQYYRATIAPFVDAAEVYDAEAILLSIQNISAQINMIEMLKENVEYDPELSVPVLNLRAYQDAVDSMTRIGAEGFNEFVFSIDNYGELKALCSRTDVLNIENLAVRRIEKMLSGFEHYAVCRKQEGVFLIYAKADRPSLYSVLNNVVDGMIGVSAKSRKGQKSVPTMLTIKPTDL